MIEVAFALSFEHEMGEQSAKFHFTRELVAAVVSGCAVRLLQSMASVSLSVEYLHTLGGGMIDAEVMCACNQDNSQSRADLIIVFCEACTESSDGEVHSDDDEHSSCDVIDGETKDRQVDGVVWGVSATSHGVCQRPVRLPSVVLFAFVI